MIRHDVPASQLTTLAVGGPIATIVDVESEDQLLAALAENPEAICMGGGSNLLVSDGGYRGTVIRCRTISTQQCRIDGDLVHVEAPVDWDVFVQFTIANRLQGLEATSGVPGSFGGAIVQNLGAYGQEIADVIVEVRAWNTLERRVETLSREACAFAYRNSRFKHDVGRTHVVTSATLQLSHGDSAVPRYGDVSEMLQARHGEGPYALSAIRDAVLDVRRSKGMLLGASLPSAGSFFVNPVIDSSRAGELTDRGLKPYTRTDGSTLVSAAAIIQAVGYTPGFRLGAAALSEKHVLAVVNTGEASASEIVDLARRVRDDVYEQFDIVLTPEPVTLGWKNDPFA